MDKKKLEKILEIKEKQKEEKKKELKMALQELKFEQENLKTLKKEMENMEEILSSELITSNLELYHRYLNILNKKIDQKETDVQIKDSVVKDREKELLQAYKETKAFDIVKDNIMRDEIKKVIINEQKESDFDFLVRKLKK